MEQIYFIYSELEKPFWNLNYLERRERFTLSAHSHKFWQVIIVTEGELTVTTDRGCDTLTAGSLHILPPNHTHALYSDGYRQVGIDFSEELFPGLNVSELFPTPAVISVPQLSEYIRTLISLDRNDSISRRLQKSLCEVILLTAFKGAVSTPDESAGHRISGYIDAHLGDSFRLEDISEELFVSVSQLERLSRKHFGMGVASLRNRKRYEKACAQLVGTSEQICDIAAALGFSEPPNFSAFFKRYAGISPAEYRRRFRENGSMADK